jgi:hypothetical protein
MGADFIAIHFDGVKYLKVQLKSRLTFDKKYIGKEIFICFFDKDRFIYPHDELLELFKLEIQDSASWIDKGLYHYPYLNPKNILRLDDYTVK